MALSRLMGEDDPVKLVCLAALAAVALLPAAVSARGSAEPTGKIVVVCASLDPHAHQICTVNPDGTGWKFLTHGPERFDSTYPEFSPDGKRIVFERGPNGGHTDTYVMSSDGTGVHRLTHCDNCYGEDSPSYSPTGSTIAFHRDPRTSRGGIFLMNADGSHVRQLTRESCDCYDGGPSFAPDGKRLVFGRFQNRTRLSALFTIGLDGHGLRRITSWKLRAAFPDWSPDGKLIAFFNNDYEQLLPGISRNLYVIRPDGLGRKALTHARGGAEQNYQPAWSPDGNWIAFTREPNSQRTPRVHGDNDVYIMRADGSELRRIAAPPRGGGFNVDWGK